MMIELCHCNHGIPGLEELPPHYHPASQGDRYDYSRTFPRLIRDPNAEPVFHVDWKSLYRELTTTP